MFDLFSRRKKQNRDLAPLQEESGEEHFSSNQSSYYNHSSNHIGHDELWSTKRWKRLRKEFPLQPPLLRMPRMHHADWSRIYEGPSHLDMPGRRIRKGCSIDRFDVEHLEVLDLHRCQHDMLLRLDRPDCIRDNLVSVVLLVLLLLSLLASAISTWVRFIDYFSSSFSWEWVLHLDVALCLLIFVTRWKTIVVRTSRAAFLWIDVSSEQLEIAGVVLCMQIRQHILSSVFGLLLCSDYNIDYMGKLLKWKSFNQHDLKVSELRENMYCEGYATSHCTFLHQDYGMIEFIWETPLLTRSTLKPLLQDQHNHVYHINEQWMHPWCRMPIHHSVDIHSTEIAEVVERNELWRKLEFRLQAEESNLSGFRAYIGDYVFNRRFNFLVVFLVVPFIVCTAVYYFYQYFNEVSEHQNNPEIMLPNFFFVAGLAVSVNIFPFFATSPWFTKWFVNMCMCTLERQANKDLDLLIGAVKDNDEREDETDSISILWQRFTSEENIRRLADEVWTHAVKQRYLKAAAVSISESISRRAGEVWTAGGCGGR